jgi:hypothetical protein
VFLPYAQDNQGHTLFERIQQNRFQGLLLQENFGPTRIAVRYTKYPLDEHRDRSFVGILSN